MVKSYIGRVELADPQGPRKGLVKVQLLRKGEWAHKNAPNGRLVIDDALLDRLQAKLDGSELPMDLNHTDPNFTYSKGWIKDVERTADGFDAYVKPTPSVLKAIQDEEIKYVSAVIDFNHVDRQTGVSGPALRGAAWTNVPYLGRKMRPAEILNLADVQGAEGQAFGGDESEGGGKPSLADAADDDALDDALPDQCRSCALLFSGECPFAGTETKMAAAGDGTCPRYEAQGAYEEDPGPRDQPMADTPPNETKLADLETRLTNLSEAFEAEKAANKVLATQLESERGKRVELSEAHRRQSDDAFLRGLTGEGRIKPCHVELAETILNQARGASGVVTLSEIAEGKEVDLDKAPSLEENLRTLLSELEPQVDLSALAESGEVRLAATRSKGGKGFDAYVEEVRTDMAKAANVPTSQIGYGEAARKAAATWKEGM